MSEISLGTPETGSTQPWGGVTDPLRHDPTHFRYLVHVDSGINTALVQEKATEEDWNYAIFDLALLKQREYLSSSLVDENHKLLYQGTGSNHGFIIEAPVSAIIAAHSMDMFSKVRDLDALRASFPAPDADQLLTDTKATDWNEVAVSPEDLVIKAVFWVDGQRTDEEPTVSRETVQQAAARLGLPFLVLDLVKY